MATSVTLAREIAYDTFVEVMENKRKPEEVLDEFYKKNINHLKRLDRNLIKEIVYGGLRWYSKILWILQHTSSRNLSEVTPQIRSALILGTYQIFYLDRVPDRAAVNESVEYVRKKGQGNAVSFVNGILRQISRRAEYFAKPDKKAKPAEYLSLQFAFPKWMVDRWLEQFKFDRLEAMLTAINQPAPHAVRINTMKVPVEEAHLFQQQLLRDERTHSERSNLRCSLTLKEAPNLEAESLFSRGFYTIQDEAAQLISYLVEPKAGEAITDAACGPGGKISHMYALSEGKAHITGIEVKPSQMQRAKDTCARLGYVDGITWVESDFLAWKPETPQDKVLVDAPCSGLGVLRRHPEGKWHKEQTLIRTMAEIQKRFLSSALKMVKVGGEVIYSVCSAEPEETEDILSWATREYGDALEIISPITRLPDYYKRYVTRKNLLLIYAGNQDNMDGFGAFILRVTKPLGK